jgi:uncharacterized protein
MTQAHLSVAERLARSGPKRVLSLDGGGVRGLLALGLLSEIEARLIARSGDPQTRLCDYYDLIGGTSTGAIIAAGLALGRSVTELTALYLRLAPVVFDEDRAAQGIQRSRFDADTLEKILVAELGLHTLDSPALRTGLALFTKRLDTGSAWTITNNPNGRYWNGADGAAPNRGFHLHKVVLASAAAPTFFEGRRIQVGADGAVGEFVDGAVAGLNNPALKLMKLATLSAYGFGWSIGADRLLMTSIGCGFWRPAVTDADLGDFPLARLAPVAAKGVLSLKAMIADVDLQTTTTMQALSQSPRPWSINAELGEMRGQLLSPFPLLHFQRFDTRLDEAGLKQVGVTADARTIRALRTLASDDADTLSLLYDVGVKAGQGYFRTPPGMPDRVWERDYFPRAFNPQGFIRRKNKGPALRLEALGRVFDRPKGG